MASKIFVNLPVKDLNKSIAFFKALGYSFNPQFTDETATCMVISEDIYSMLLTHPKFQEFIPGKIADATQATEVAVCLSVDSKEEVDAMVAKAVAAGGTVFRKPTDYGFMYYHSFQDLDGHLWEYIWMDPSTIKKEG